MSPRTERSPAASDEIAQLRDEVTDLKNQVSALSNILDEIRVDLQCVTQNGLPIREPLPTCPTLKRMALDPCAVDWDERLVIDFAAPTQTGNKTASPVPIADAKSPNAHVGKPPAGKLFGVAGDQGRLF